MESKQEVNNLKRELSKEYKPIKSPIIQLMDYFTDRNKRKKLKEIEDLKLEIQKAKLERELKEI